MIRVPVDIETDTPVVNLNLKLLHRSHNKHLRIN